jgi:hypothetical protein
MGAEPGRLDAETRSRLLRECWWAHDGQWFLKSASALGLEAAMALNEDTIESMGRIEMRRLHAALGAPAVHGAADLLPLVLEAQELIGIPAGGEMDGGQSFVLDVRDCLVWPMTEAAGLELAAPGCRGSLRRRLGWATVFFPVERIAWTREAGRPDGDPACRYRFRLLPAGG